MLSYILRTQAMKHQNNETAKESVFYRRNLPHIHPQNGLFFITFRLAGSLPVPIIQQLKNEREIQIKTLAQKLSPKELATETCKIDKRNFAKFDEWLDNSSEGPQWLLDQDVAQIVANKIHELDGQRFRLIAYCIMSNHVHLLIDMIDFDNCMQGKLRGKTKDYPLADILRLLKGSTARKCNLKLERSGAFWHNESYDHYVRDGEELGRIVEYILNNPIKAGLVEEWQEWRFNYCNTTFMS